MVSWTMPIDEATDFTSVEFVRMFWAALRERQMVRVDRFSYGGWAWDTWSKPLPEAGDYVTCASDRQPGSVYGGLNATATWSIRRLQIEVERLTLPELGWARTDVEMHLNETLASGRLTDFSWSLETWRSAGGFAGGFRRKRPREIATADDAVDTMGNVASAGQRALLTGRVHEHDGTRWTPAEGAADVLDSSSAAPNGMPAGLVEPGDYVGPWIWQELRTGLNLLRWTVHTSTWVNRVREWGTGLAVGWDAAEAAYVADFGHAEATLGPLGAYLQRLLVAGYETVKGEATRGEAVSPGVENAWFVPFNATMPCTGEFWVYPVADYGGVYHALGSGLVENRWNRWCTIGEQTGSSRSSGVSLAAAMPTPMVDYPARDLTAPRHGWRVENTETSARWTCFVAKWGFEFVG